MSSRARAPPPEAVSHARAAPCAPSSSDAPREGRPRLEWLLGDGISPSGWERRRSCLIRRFAAHIRKRNFLGSWKWRERQSTTHQNPAGAPGLNFRTCGCTRRSLAQTSRRHPRGCQHGQSCLPMGFRRRPHLAETRRRNAPAWRHMCAMLQTHVPPYHTNADLIHKCNLHRPPRGERHMHRSDSMTADKCIKMPRAPHFSPQARARLGACFSVALITYIHHKSQACQTHAQGRHPRHDAIVGLLN